MLLVIRSYENLIVFSPLKFLFFCRQLFLAVHWISWCRPHSVLSLPTSSFRFQVGMSNMCRRHWFVVDGHATAAELCEWDGAMDRDISAVSLYWHSSVTTQKSKSKKTEKRNEIPARKIWKRRPLFVVFSF